ERGEGGAGRRREAAGQRLAVAARRGQGVRRRRVAAPGAVEERDLLRAAAPDRGEQPVALAVGQAGRVHVVALGRAHPALLAEHDGHGLAGDQFGLVQRLRGLALDQRRTAGVAVLLRVGQQLLLDQLLQLRAAAEGGDDPLQLLRQFLLLATDL